MRPRRDPVPRAKEAWWWLGGLLTLGLVGGGVVAAGVALWENIDIRQLAPALASAPAPPPVPVAPRPSASASERFSVVLYRSDRNASFFPNADFYGDQMARWRRVADQAGGQVREVSGPEALAALAPDDVLLLPEAPCLSQRERTAIRGHLRRGGSLATNWATGVRDGSCEWLGWQTLLEITEAEAIRELTGRQALYFTVPAGLPTSPGLDPGARVELRPDPAIALRMPGPRIYWSDWALNPTPDDEGTGADVAVATTVSAAGGRVSWFGVRADQAASAADSVRLERVLENGIRWAAGRAHAAPSPWPGGARTALVFTVDVEGLDAYRNAADAAAMFGQEGVPVTFYPVSQLVQDDEELGRTLVAVGEVGTQTVDHAPLAGLTAQDQRIRLRRSWSDVLDWTGEPPQGLRAPEEVVDAVTLDAWRRAGGSYVLAGNEARSASPEIHQTEGGPMVLLPRLMKDDYTIIVRDVTIRSRSLAEAFLAGTRKLRAIGGLAVVAAHTQIIEPGPRLEALRTVADSVRAQEGWWIAEARDVARWWRDRSRVELAWVPATELNGATMASALGEDLLVG
ncbi:MAG: polysaccharide deacetylase family protein, partial [Longimicrobiales bacterium]|nr:polysaccharide deacetylase family protein [Longimicrobiales bacterium]